MEEESILHVLRDCQAVVFVWMHIIKAEDRSAFFYGNLNQQISLNLSNAMGTVDGVEAKWVDLWATTCYYLWRWRNLMVHEDQFNRPFKP